TRANLFAGSNNGVFRSSDAGASWSPADNGLGSRNARLVTAIGASLFAGTTDAGLFRSSDEGASWTKVDDLQDLNGFGLGASGTSLLAATDRGVFRSTDHGDHWTGVVTGQRVLSLAAGARSISADGPPRFAPLFAATDLGRVLRS